jgi:Bacterial CdiA-CT RNAse A domain
MMLLPMTPSRTDRPAGRSGGGASAGKLIALVLILLAGWLLHRRDTALPAPGAPAQARSEPRDGADRPSRRDPRAPAPDAAAASDDRYDLEADESRGGHTLSRHVGRTDAQLRERLADEPNISTASTYTNRALAERTVARTLRANAARVDAWSARSGNRPNLELDYHGPRTEVIGRSIRRGQDSVDCTNAILVLRWHGQSYYVLTTYPEPSR